MGLLGLDKEAEMVQNVAGYEIIIAGRVVKWPSDWITYEEVKAEWDKHSPDRTVMGDPPINYTRENGESGILLPTESIKVEDGLSITVDPSHLS